MQQRIEDDEVTVLVWLRENAKGMGRRFAFSADHVAENTGMGLDRLVKAATYLEGWGLIGLSGDLAADADPIGGPYLTSQGEAYLREIDDRLQQQKLLPRGKRLGMAALKGAFDTVLKIGVDVLTELAKRGL